MIMPISFIPYPLPKPSEWLTLTPWFSKSPPSSPVLPSPSSSPKAQRSSATMSSRPTPPAPILLHSPVTTTATSIKTPEMTQVRQHAIISGGTFLFPRSDKVQVAHQSSGGSNEREDQRNINDPVSTKMKKKTKNNETEAVIEETPRSVQPRALKQNDVVWLFDLKSARGAVPWHPNTWKIRLALNYKQIPYTTVWLSYPSMEPVLKQLGVPPMQRNRTGKVHYSVPVIVDWRMCSTGTGGGRGQQQNQGELWAVSGSERILDYLDGTSVITITTRSTSSSNHTSRSRKSKSQSPPPLSSSSSSSRSQSHPPSSSYRSYSGSTAASSSSTSLARRPKLLQSMFDSMVERVLDPPFWKMILPLAWIGGVLDEESKVYILKIKGYPVGEGGLGASAGVDADADNIGQTENTSTSGRTKRWNPERYVTSRDWDALRDGFETIAAFCEMHGIEIGGIAKGKDSSSSDEERSRHPDSDSDSDSGSTGSLVLTRVEIVLIAYLAALHECVSSEKWAEIKDTWCSGAWGVLWDRSAHVRSNVA